MDKEWDDTYDEEWTKEVAIWSWKRQGDVLRTEGSCPRCGHHISREIERSSTTLRTLTASPTEQVTVVTVRCNCTGAHPGRPKKEQSGCGPAASFLLPLA